MTIVSIVIPVYNEGEAISETYVWVFEVREE